MSAFFVLAGLAFTAVTVTVVLAVVGLFVKLAIRLLLLFGQARHLMRCLGSLLLE